MHSSFADGSTYKSGKYTITDFIQMKMTLEDGFSIYSYSLSDKINGSDGYITSGFNAAALAIATAWWKRKPKW